MQGSLSLRRRARRGCNLRATTAIGHRGGHASRGDAVLVAVAGPQWRLRAVGELAGQHRLPHGARARTICSGEATPDYVD